MIPKMGPEEAKRAYRKDPARFFDALLQERPDDRSLIDPNWSWMETAYHYNLVENGIIAFLVGHGLDPADFHVLDVGTGNGHWIGFYRHVVGVAAVTGLDFTQTAVERQQERFAGDDSVQVRQADVTEPLPDLGPFDLVNAIGVLFHIVDDAKWERGLANLTGFLAPGGLLIAGGDFGDATEMRGVMRKIRSRDIWQGALETMGMEILEVVRFDWWRGADAGGITDNLLFARKRDG